MQYISTPDRVSIDRLKLLHYKIRDCAIQGYHELLKEGISIRVTRAYSTFEEQAKIYAQGRLTPGKIVTWAKPGYSFHNYQLAFDFVLLVRSDTVKTEVSWDMALDLDGDKISDWKEVVSKFEGLGWYWGGNFPNGKKDYPHLQKTLGLTITKCMELSKMGTILDFDIPD